MFFKDSLIEQYILTDIISSILPIDLKEIKSNVIKNYAFKNFQNDSDWNYLNQYYNLDDDVNITWIQDYIRDHYRVDYGKTPVILKRAGLIQNYNEAIDFHQHIDEYNMEGSPDISAIVTIDCAEEEPSFVEFEYEGGRKRHMKSRVKLENKKIILFNSELRHRFLPNKNKKPLINLSLKFQLI